MTSKEEEMWIKILGWEGQEVKLTTGSTFPPIKKGERGIVIRARQLGGKELKFTFLTIHFSRDRTLHTFPHEVSFSK